MKMLNLVILVLAVTLFVACSKKKDGNSTPQPQLPYGTTPTDQMYGNGYPNGPQPIMPGYQLPNQANCQGPGQMFSDLVSYCGWLARDGERLCNPMVVRQNFIQYCQSFAVRFNYCVPEIRSNCYYKQGCAVQVKGTWERYSHSSKRKRDSGSWTSQQGGQVIVGPITPVPPNDSEPEEQNDCKPNVSEDCKKENPKKPKLICKLPGDSSSEENYVYDLADYKALACKDSSSSRFRRTARTTLVQKTETRTTAPVVQKQNTQNQVETVDSMTSTVTSQNMAADVVSKSVSTSAVDVSQCLNIQEIHEYILDQKNGLSSSAEYYQAELLDKNLSKNFVNAWKSAMRPILEKYSVSVYSRYSHLSAIGANISQNNDLVQVQKVADFGKIISCNSGKQMTIQFPNEVGVQQIIYTTNGLDKSDSDFEVTETTRGIFKYGNETGTYLLSRYIGVGKNLSEQKIQTKVIADMKRKKYIEIDPESVINQ